MKNFAAPRSPDRAGTLRDGSQMMHRVRPAPTGTSANAMPFTLLSDDELIARLLIHTWTLTTGKALRGDVPPHELTEEELIDFWSDDRFD
jgi:hypothetical protein